MTNKNDKILAPIKGRVIQFIEKQNIEKKFFFEKLGVASSNFRGKALFSEISADIIAKILSLYPDSNPEWFLIGKEPMLKSEQNQLLAGSVNDNEIIALLRENNAILKTQLKDKEKINALQEEKITKLEADIKRLRGKEITAMEDKIELQRQQIQHLTSSMPSVSDTAQRKNLPRL